MHKISVITPNYNYSQFLPALFESIINQDFDNWEHIIVDDGSTDNSVEVIQKYVKKYPDRIKLIIQENKGQTVAMNRAIIEVTGDIIGWINSDDYYNAGAFTKVIQAFENNQSIDAVFGDISIINNDSELIKINKYLKFDYASGVFNGFGKIVSSNAIFWRKRLTDDIGLFKVSFQYAMDAEYWSRLLYKRKVSKINYVIAGFRWHEGSKTIQGQNKDKSAFQIANNEKYKIMEDSYRNLKISKVLPIKYSKPIWFIYRLKRFFYKGISGHYLNNKT